MKKIAYIITGDGTITLFIENKNYAIDKEHINYSKIKENLINKNYDNISSLVDISDSVIRKSMGKVTIKDGVVYYGTKPIHNAITKQIINLIKQDFPFEFMVKFLENLMSNPSESSKEQLYRFLEFNTLPITPNGCFLAYKRVRDDYKDFYSGRFDNSIGKRPQEPRNLVEENPELTCSRGLHICSLQYLKSYHGGEGRIMINEINPRDVVSVPTDYKNTKIRVCEYLVVAEYDKDDVDMFDGDSVRNSDGSKYIQPESEDDCDDCDDYDDCDDCGIDACECGLCESPSLSQSWNYQKQDDNACNPKESSVKYHNVRGKDGKFVKKNK